MMKRASYCRLSGGKGGEEGTRWEELLDKALVQTSAETNSTIFDCYLHIMVIKFC